MSDYLTPDEVDDLLKLPHGRAARLARRGRLPACVLPDGTIRFDAQELSTFLKTKPAPSAASSTITAPSADGGAK